MTTPWSFLREDGPNTTATNKTINYNNTLGNMTLHSQDDTFKGVPSRVVTNMTVNVNEDELASAPILASKGVESELQEVARTGRVQLVTPVDGDAQSVEFKRIAGTNGADYGEVDHEGSRYAVMIPNAKKAVNETSDSFKMADALASGYKPEEVSKYLTEQGYDEAQVARLTEQATKVTQARQAGYNDEEISQFLGERETKVSEVKSAPVEQPETEGNWSATSFGSPYGGGRFIQIPGMPYGALKTKQQAYSDLMGDGSMSAEELLTSLRVLQPNMASMTTRTAGFFGNEEAARKAEAGVQSARTKIIGMAKERGLDLVWDDDTGAFLAQTPNGPTPIEEGMWDEIWSQKGELTGGVAGAILGAKGGAAAGSSFGPLGTGVGGVLGSLGGAAVGSAVGSQFDYMYQAIKLQEDLEGQVMAHKALTAAEMSVAGDVLGLGVVKGSGATLRAVKRVKDFVMDGNTAGAYKALKDVEFITDDQASNLVTQMQKISGTQGLDTTKSFEEQAITTAALTNPGTESLVKAAVSLEPQAGRAVSKAINDRARDLLTATNELSGESLGRLLREDLGNYVMDVKQNFARVKSIPAQSPKSANFRFDYDKLAVQPVIDTLQKNIMDPAVLEKFKLQAQHVRDMSDSRTFTDLLELRQLVNEFKYNKKITKAKDFETLNTVISNIDKEITTGAKVTLEKPDEWLSDYAFARADYAKMKQLERNVMYKAMSKPGVNEDEITKNLARYITSLDGTFNDMTSKLPMDMRARVENSVVDTLANKFTAGAGEGMRAVNFPLLARELNQVTMTTPDARRMKAAIGELAEVFRNDVPLSQVTGTIQIPKFQSYLTADPIVRAKYEIASKMFNYVKTLIPNKEQGTLALVRKTATLLENPLNAKSVRDLMEEAAGKVDVAPEIVKMQQEVARTAALGKDTTMPRVKLYGTGSVLSPKKGAGPEQTIPLHRIASINDAVTIANREGINPTDTRLLDGILTSYGFKAVQQGTDRVRIIKGQ